MKAAGNLGRQARTNWPFLVGALGVVAGLIMAFVVPAVADSSWSKQAKAAESVASDFIVTCYAIDTQDVEATASALKPLVTDEFTTTCLDFLAPTDEEKAAFASSQVTFGDTVISSIGTPQVDGDSANVLVTYSFTATSPQATTAIPFASRGIVHLAKVDDDWLVNDFSEIVQVDATLEDTATEEAQ